MAELAQPAETGAADRCVRRIRLENELHGPEGAAYLRLLMSLGPRAVKRKAIEALAEFTADGVYPPEWVTSIGRPTPGQAWRLYDVTGDREVIAVTYRYEDAEHTLLFAIDLVELPLVGVILVGDDADGMIRPCETISSPGNASSRSRRPRPGGASNQHSPGPRRSGLSIQTNLDPVPAAGQSRLRRLPSDDPGEAVVTRPPTVPPPLTSSCAAPTVPTPATRRPRGSGRRFSPGTAAGYPASRLPRSARQGSPPCCSRTFRARSRCRRGSATAWGRR